MQVLQVLKIGKTFRAESIQEALFRIRVLSQVVRVGFGWMERKMLACFESVLEPADALCWLWWRWAWGLLGKVKASDEVAGFRRFRALPSWAKWELLELFPTPNESSFRTLTCLLAKPQEGNDAALAPCLPGRSFTQEHRKEWTFRQRLPVVLKSSDCINQLLVSSGWRPTYLSRCDICLSLNAVGSGSSCGVKVSGGILLLYSFSLPWTQPLSPQSVSILAIWPLHSSKSWFGLFTFWMTDY